MKYRHINSGAIIEVTEVNEKSKTVVYVDENGKSKSCTTSTLKRWYKPIEDEVAPVAKKEVKKVAKAVEKPAAPEVSDEPADDKTPLNEVGKEIAAQAKAKAEKAAAKKAPKEKKASQPRKKKEMEPYVTEALEFIYSKVEAEGDEVFKPATDINMRAFKVGGHMYCKFNFSMSSITLAVSSKAFNEKNAIAPTRTIKHLFDNLYTYNKALTKADKDQIVKILKLARAYRMEKNNHSSQKKTSKKKEAK